MSKENGFGFAKVKVDSLIYGTTKIPKQNSKVFEQKGDLLNFKANIDSMSQAEPS